MFAILVGKQVVSCLQVNRVLHLYTVKVKFAENYQIYECNGLTIVQSVIQLFLL